MCFSADKTFRRSGAPSSFETQEVTVTRVGGEKALGAALTALLAAYVGSSRLDLASHTQSRRLAFCVLLIWSIKLMRHLWGRLVECAHQVDDVMLRVSSSQAMTRIKSSVSASSMRLMDFATGLDAAVRGGGVELRVENRSPIITAYAPFLLLQATEELSLSDMKNLMRFAMEVSRLDFDKTVFLSKLSDRCREAVDAIDRVVLVSRGATTAISTSPIRENRSPDACDMDALVFTAVVRVFAEWRSLRLVPGGHPRYAMGMELARRDLIQNAQKIETAVHNWMAHNELLHRSVVEVVPGRQVSGEKFRTVAPLYLHDISHVFGIVCSYRARLSGSSCFGKASKIYTLGCRGSLTSRAHPGFCGYSVNFNIKLPFFTILRLCPRRSRRRRRRSLRPTKQHTNRSMDFSSSKYFAARLKRPPTHMKFSAT